MEEEFEDNDYTDNEEITDENLDDEEFQENQEQQEEYEDYEVPSYIPDEFVPPEAFEKPEDELSFYKEHYIKLMEHLDSESAHEYYRNKYSDDLINEDKEYEKLRAVKNLVESGNPEEYIKIYAPDYLVKNRVNAGYNDEEIANIVINRMKAEFGEDYKDNYDQEKAGIKGTLSQRMYERQTQLIENIKQHNDYVNSQVESNKPPSQEQIFEELNKQYNDDFAETLEPGEYSEFANYAIEYAKNNKISMLDMHKMLYFDEYTEDAYKKGLQDGKKGLVNEISNRHNVSMNHRPIQRNDVKEEEYNEFGSFGRVSPLDLIKHI